MSFLETASQQLGTSWSFRKYISKHLEKDQNFQQLVANYAALKLDYSAKRERYPEDRHIDVNTKELIWIAAVNANDIADFSQRITGYLPHEDHIAFVQVLEQAMPYYEELVWKKEQKKVRKLQKQLGKYKTEIADAFLKISKFYNTSWNKKIPFKVAVYPIPLASGNTSAIPMGNTLICGFLSQREDDYEAQLGIIIHEMCHILYKEQAAAFQHQLKKWFKTSDSPYANLAYSYLDEGLATALGNGWAYEQINGKMDTGEWYNNKYIDGFAHMMFPMVSLYLREQKAIDQDFANQVIALFGQKFPKATHDINILMNHIELFANTEEEAEIDQMMNDIHDNFRIRSLWFYSTIVSGEHADKFKLGESTKLVVVHSAHEKSVEMIKAAFPNSKISNTLNTIQVFRDKTTKNPVIIINIAKASDLGKGLAFLEELAYVEFGKQYELK